MEYKLNKDTLKKLLYNESADDNQRMFLNINLLRHFKNYVLECMTIKERGCINLYHLENYLIERALDPMTEELYRECEHIICDTLKYLRSKPEYWIINSEIYLELISNCEDNCYQVDKYENKDLSAIYNYIYNYDFFKPLESNNHLPEDNQTLVNDAEYLNFVRLIEKESFLEIDETYKTIFDVTLVPLIYKFILEKYDKLIKNHNELFNANLKTYVQNFILFFSYVQYDKLLDCIWNTKSNIKVKNFLAPAAKKYSLRINKINEQELDQIFLQNQIKILSLEDQINQLKDHKMVLEFFTFLKKYNITQEILKGENSDKSDFKFKIETFAYQILINILGLVEEYICMRINDTERELKVNFTNKQQNFEIYKNFKLIYAETLNKFHLNQFVKFYVMLIENKKEFGGSITIINRYKEFSSHKYKTGQREIGDNYKFENIFGSNLTEKVLNQLSDNYLNEYYDSGENKLKRIYKMEHAGVNWTEEDLRKYKEGLNLFGNCQLANIKIAKFMGPHIEASHVKLFRSRISKEKRIKRKFEKETKISEMKKKRHLVWKAVKEEDIIFDQVII